MLYDLTFPCYLTTFSGKRCLSGKVICAFFAPLIEVLLYWQNTYPVFWLIQGSANESGLKFSLIRCHIDNLTKSV
jgi:hypothetical protein